MVNVQALSASLKNVIMLTLTWTICIAYRNQRKWDAISVRFGFWTSLPPYQPMAAAKGYKRLNDVCKTDYYHGFLFSKGDNRRPMPIYDMDGNLAGIQIKLPANLWGYNSQNQSIPVSTTMGPPVLMAYTNRDGVSFYTVTAYFKHPALMCSPIVPENVDPGRGLYIQMGFQPAVDYLQVPYNSRDLSHRWLPGTCRPQMGTHYYMNLSKSMPCESLYPLFLLYDMDGTLGAFGWVFQGRPNNFQAEEGFYLTPDTYPFIFNTSMLPACMFYEKFQVFGVHIYLRPPTSLICTRNAPGKNKTNSFSQKTIDVRVQHHNDIESSSELTNDISSPRGEDGKSQNAYNNAQETRNNGHSMLSDINAIFPAVICLLFMKLYR